MLKELLKQLYLNLENEIENDRKNKTGNFDFFEERILKQERFKKYKNVSVTSKTMKNYYEKHVEGRKNKSKEPNIDLKNLIAEYLNYESYTDFISKSVIIKSSKKNNKKSTNFSSLKLYRKLSHQMAMCCCILFISTLSLFFYKNDHQPNNNYIVVHDLHHEKNINDKHAVNITILKKETVKKNTIFF
ncbi:hypothetical protein [Tenacibaculum aiptasiae]|uniref:hypothetical protein n=1 Tax=Tenacibaculum aiptasiae TaxID=426481 RepID=UPI003B59FCA1